MSIEAKIRAIETARNTIRTKLVSLGLVESTAKLDACATAIHNIKDNGSISAQVKEGETYTIPEGMHDGTGTVMGIAGGGNYNLQSKEITPTKSQQAITPDEGYFGLSDVKVKAIPENFQDVSDVTAEAGDVLANKVIVKADGTVVTGSMPNNGTVTEQLDVDTPSFTIPKGYHSGTGIVKIEKEAKTVSPTKSQQSIKPTNGKVLEEVTVGAIPASFFDVSGVTAEVGDVLAGKKIVKSDGTVVTGTMANNGAVSASIDGFESTEYIIPAGYHSGLGKVSLTSDIEEALAAI